MGNISSGHVSPVSLVKFVFFGCPRLRADRQKILVAKTLKEIDATLSGKDFVRVHNSYLVNINHISRFVRGDGGYVVMPDGEQITIARSKRDAFFQLFAKF